MTVSNTENMETVCVPNSTPRGRGPSHWPHWPREAAILKIPTSSLCAEGLPEASVQPREGLGATPGPESQQKGSRGLFCGSRREAAVGWHAGGGAGGLRGGPAGGAYKALSQRAEGTVQGFVGCGQAQ